MNSKVNLNTKAGDWQQFLNQFEHQIYVQTKAYGDFYKNTGDDFQIVTVQQKGKIVLGAVTFIVIAKRGNFIYLPYGPLVSKQAKYADFKLFLDSLSQLKNKYAVNFIRISPFYTKQDSIYKWFKKAGLIKAPMHMIAEDCWFLKLDQPPELLLKGMRQNHRNLIKRAHRQGVTIVKSQDVKDVRVLSDLLNETAKRHNFTPFSYQYLLQEFQAFQKRGVRIYKAYYDSEVVAASMHFFNGTHAVYKHGASNLKHPKIPASYLLQFQAISDAYEEGFKYYNFWGIAPPNSRKHPFKGITTFKKGFSGEHRALIPAHDKILSYKYLINFIVEMFRKIKRGF